MIECDACEGTGIVPTFEDCADYRGEHYTEDGEATCPECHGAGHLLCIICLERPAVMSLVDDRELACHECWVRCSEPTVTVEMPTPSDQDLMAALDAAQRAS